MFLNGQPAYPAERTLLIFGALESLLESRHQRLVWVDTPHLDVTYASYDAPRNVRGSLVQPARALNL